MIGLCWVSVTFPYSLQIAQRPPPEAAAAELSEEGEEEEEIDEEEEEEQEDSTPWQRLLYDALHASAPPTCFACSGRLDAKPLPFLCPEVTVAGVGRLGLPLSAEQAVTLAAASEQAPYGKGLDTVVDTAVRDAHQVGGEGRFLITICHSRYNTFWQTYSAMRLRSCQKLRALFAMLTVG